MRCLSLLLLSISLVDTIASGEMPMMGPCLGSCVGEGMEKMCTFTFSVDLYASELGYYKVEECGEGVNPTLGIEKNTHYKFVQDDLTNYMHPLGFRYGDMDGMDHGDGHGGDMGGDHGDGHGDDHGGDMGGDHGGDMGGDHHGMHRDLGVHRRNMGMPDMGMNGTNGGGDMGMNDTHGGGDMGGHNDHGSHYHLEPGNTPPGSSSHCAHMKKCPSPMYFIDGEYMGVYSNCDDLAPITMNEEDFGLDETKLKFHYPVEVWANSTYEIHLKFDDANFTDDFFYFCHVHHGMAGRIKFVDSSGMPINHMDHPALGFEYQQPSHYDKKCGTYGLDEFQLPNYQCPKKYVCGKDKKRKKPGKFVNCIESMNCAMQVGMSTKMSTKSSIALFNHMMIPHHENAVNMAKALIKSGEIDCPDITSDSDDCVMLRISMEIIASQNHQIQQMKTILANKNYPEEDDCITRLRNKHFLPKTNDFNL